MANANDHWMQGAVRRPGAFTAKAKAAGMSVPAFAKAKAHAPGTLGRQARLAEIFERAAQAKRK
jgi:hypothetical protein